MQEQLSIPTHQQNSSIRRSHPFKNIIVDYIRRGTIIKTSRLRIFDKEEKYFYIQHISSKLVTWSVSQTWNDANSGTIHRRISTWSNKEVNLTANQSSFIVNFSWLPTLTKSYQTSIYNRRKYLHCSSMTNLQN